MFSRFSPFGSFFFALSLMSISSMVLCEISLPQGISNNAVAKANVNGETILFSFSGLTSGKTYKDVVSTVYSVNLATGKVNSLPGLPDGVGRLASVAATVNEQIYLFGGYSVAADHSEVSTPEVYRFNPLNNSYQLVSSMPIPVDDSVALVYMNRYVYLVSGWHNTDNVSLVQVYDSKDNVWFEATPFPGAPVFGHAAGIVDNQFIVADGVKVNGRVNGKNQYGPSDENWLAVIDRKDPKIIHWEKIPKHPFIPLYRMAATGVDSRVKIVFAGGSDNPYNFNGIGYDGNPSRPSGEVFAFDLEKHQWEKLNSLSKKTMDHRGLLDVNGTLYTLGGMGEKQQVLTGIQMISMD
ncbi:MAG: hypothetical protein KUG78_15840 [Kangiellaceae bacterium]|nr:hypothetical protein [Kangiellaceae bacterium]